MNFIQRAAASIFQLKGLTGALQHAADDWGIPFKNIANGTHVTRAEALSITTVWLACRVLAEGVAQVPWKLFRTVPAGKEPETEHVLYDLIKSKPNDIQTSFEFRETIVFHTALKGNSYIFVDRIGNDREVRSLMPLDPDRVTEPTGEGPNGDKYKVTMATGEVVMIAPEFIWHLRGPSWLPRTGMNPVSMAAGALRLAIQEEESHIEMFANGARPSGVLSVDNNLSKVKYDALVAHLKLMSKSDKRSEALVMDNGAKWMQIAMTGVDAQHIEARKLQVEEIARIFRVLPIMLMQTDKAATFASAEQMFTAHVVHTLSPWYSRIESSADCNLLTDAERKAGLYTKFIAAGLLRGASKDRAAFYKAALGAGNSPAWMTQNEVRMAEDDNKMADDESAAQADRLFFPTADQSKQDNKEPPDADT